MKYKLSDSVMLTNFNEVTYLINCETNKSIQLTGIANDIIKLIYKKEKTIDQISLFIIKRYNIDKQTVENDINKLFNDLLVEGFLISV